jgi:hypothetical protein
VSSPEAVRRRSRIRLGALTVPLEILKRYLMRRQPPACRRQVEPLWPGRGARGKVKRPAAVRPDAKIRPCPCTDSIVRAMTAERQTRALADTHSSLRRQRRPHGREEKQLPAGLRCTCERPAFEKIQPALEIGDRFLVGRAVGSKLAGFQPKAQRIRIPASA